MKKREHVPGMRGIGLFLFLVLGAALSLSVFLSQTRKRNPPLDVLLPKALSFLEAKGRTPEEYFVDKYKEYDIILAGEIHHVQQNLDLLHRLIPLLHRESGVRFLGYEFFSSSLQAEVDALVSKETYDRDLEMRIIRESAYRTGVLWAFDDYVDVFRIVWELNRGISNTSDRMRIIFMCPDIDWQQIHHGSREQRRAAAESLRKGDAHYAESILKAYESSKSKGLVWSGSTHAVTRLRQDPGRAPGMRMGGYLRKSLGKKLFQIMLHGPVPAWEGNGYDYVLGDALEKTLCEFNKPVGFDVRDSPFCTSRLSQGTMWGKDNPRATFADYCDGYIWLTPIWEFKGNRVMDVNAIVSTEDIFQKLRANACSKEVQECKSRQEYVTRFQRDVRSFQRVSETLMPSYARKDGTGGQDGNTPEN